MLKIQIPYLEGFNNETNEFITLTPSTTLILEHSLLSVAKWEAKWHKPFLSKDPKTKEEILDYIRCMNLDSSLSEDAYQYLSGDVINKVTKYIEEPMTATTFSETDKGGLPKVITSEIIYYWMVSYNIPFECQKWHLNRLLTLIRVCSIKNAPEKKLSTKEIMQRNRALNAQRKAQLHTRG